MSADRQLLFGLLALQNGIINHDQLLAAFRAWTLDHSKGLADRLAARGDLDADDRAAIEALAARHLKRHGGQIEQSLAALNAGRSTRESLARLADAGLEASLAQLGAAAVNTHEDLDRTASYGVGIATSDGQRFRVLRPHARGGLGAVFVALDAELNREVALKQLLDRHADDPTSRARFLLEAEITGGLEHPGIVPVYGLGHYGDGRPYYTMRFIRGDSLKDATERFHSDEALRKQPGRRSLELHKLLRRFVDVCYAIDYAHSRGVLHRDIKPGNIIVGRHGETLVVDWGLAKATGQAEPGAGERTLVPSSASGSAETLPGSALGTPAYMSPEQARGELEHLGPRSDVYSLGATLYCLLTGKPPLEGDDIGDVLRRAQRADFPQPRQREATIDAALEAVCLKAMALQPEDRYAAPRLLAEDVERWMADEAVSAWREPVSRRLLRWLTRHRTGVTAAAATLLMTLAGLGAVSAVQVHANGELQRANNALAAANTEVLRTNGELKEANDRVTRANDELKASNLRERERFDLAMDAIKLFHGEISEDLLLKQSQFEKLRNKLLRGAVDFYGKLEGFLKDRQDRDSLTALGRAYEELGGLTINIGTSQEALMLFQKAIQVRRALAALPGADDRLRLDLARNLRSRGAMQESMSDRTAARASYDEALAMVRGLKPAEGMSEPPYLVEARIVHNIGWQNHVMGKEEESLERLREACAIVDKGIASGAAGTAASQAEESLVFLTNTLNALGGPLAAMGRFTESLADQQRALDIMRKLLADHPDDSQKQIACVSTYFNIGALYRSMHRPDKSFPSFRAGLDILDQLVKDYPAIVEYRRFQARCLNGCGDAAEDLGRTDEAMTYFVAARSAWKKVIEDNPSRFSEPIELATTHNRIGWLFFGTGRLTEALEQYEQSRAVLQKLVDTYPRHILHRTRSELSNILINIAEIERRQGRLSEARAHCDAAIAMREGVLKEFPEIRGYRIRLGECLLRSGQVRLDAGDVSGAVDYGRRALAHYASLPKRGGELAAFEAGCHALLSRIAGTSGSGIPASEGPVEAEKAMAILRQIVAEGYRGPALHNESALEPLGSRPDFRLMMMDLAMPAEAFAKTR